MTRPDPRCTEHEKTAEKRRIQHGDVVTCTEESGIRRIVVSHKISEHKLVQYFIRNLKNVPLTSTGKISNLAQTIHAQQGVYTSFAQVALWTWFPTSQWHLIEKKLCWLCSSVPSLPEVDSDLGQCSLQMSPYVIYPASLTPDLFL